MASARITEAQLARLKDDLKYHEHERYGFLREVKQLQGELCKARRDVTRAERTAERHACDMEQYFAAKISGMERETARLKQQVHDGNSSKASARVTQLCQQRKLKAAQEQLRRQEEDFNALQAEYCGLQSENVQFQAEKQGWCHQQLMAQKFKAPFWVTEPGQQSQLWREIQDELRDQKFELSLARSQARCADRQKQLSEAKQQQLLDQVAQLQNQLKEVLNSSSDQPQHQQTVGDGGATQALEAKVFELPSEIQQLKAINQGLQQQLRATSCQMTSLEKPSDDRKVLLDNIQGLENKIAAMETRLEEYKQVFVYQQEALDLYAPLPAFMPVSIPIQPSTVTADSTKSDGCCAKCSGTLENDTVEALKKEIAAAEAARAWESQQHQQESKKLQQMVAEHAEALAAAAGLKEQLDYSKHQLLEQNESLKAAYDELAQKQSEALSMSSTVANLEDEKMRLKEEGQCALQTNQLLQEQAADLQCQLLQLQSVVSELKQEHALKQQQHQQEVKEYEQMLVEQTDALDAAAELRQELDDLKEQQDQLKKQLFELDACLNASYDKVAQKEAEVVSVNMIVSKLQQDKIRLEEQAQCALQRNQLLQAQVAGLQGQLLQQQCVVSDLQQEHALAKYQHQQEIKEYEQMVVEQTAALAAIARLQRELTDLKEERGYLKEQLFELDADLNASYDKVAQKEAEVVSVASTVTRLEHEKLQLELQGHCAVLKNHLLQQQVADLHCQLLQLQYMVSNLQQQQDHQHPTEIDEQALITVRQQQLKPLRTVRDNSDPVDAPSTPELGAGSCAEADSGLLQPNADVGGSSSSSQCDADSIAFTDRPANRGNRAYGLAVWWLQQQQLSLGFVLPG